MDISIILLVALVALVVSVVLAGIFISRWKVWQGILLGLAPIAIMEILLLMSLRPKVSSCIDAACAAAGLGPGCQINNFHCSEWSGLAVFFIEIAGIVDLLIYLLAATLIALIFRRSRRKGRPDRDAAEA